jgi:hypothetical protein
MRKHLDFCARLFEQRAGGPDQEVAAHQEVAAWLRAVARILAEHQHLLGQAAVSPAERFGLLDALQRAFEAYRSRAYAGLTPGGTIDLREAAQLLRLARDFVDHTLRQSRRPDGLYHSYNLLELREGHAEVEPLYEMLEGQVSVLGSGLLGAGEALEVLEALFRSRMWREDQQSFLLYPERALPSFLEKNVIPEEEVARSPLLTALLAHGKAFVLARDVWGRVRFASELSTPELLRTALARAGKDAALAPLVEAHGAEALACYARVFELKRFTGRSGTMYGYEGLGCIYWHMVAKLLLAVQEAHHAALAAGADPAQVQALAAAYDRVRAGLCFNKTARAYGAFPTDPYSHTPRHAGAQQPGMTGSVKEMILARLGELGVRVEDGRLSLLPRLLHEAELLQAPAELPWYGPDGARRSKRLEAGELGFTLCEVPVIYRRGGAASASITFASGEARTFPGARLDEASTRALFSREGSVALVEVTLAPEALRRSQP